MQPGNEPEQTMCPQSFLVSLILLAACLVIGPVSDIEAVDGPVGVIDCVLEPDSCDRIDYCECIGVWRDINSAITRVLGRYSLEDLIARGEPQGREGLVCFAQHRNKA